LGRAAKQELDMRQIVVTQTGAGNSVPIPVDIHGRPDISLQVTVSGTVNWTVQQTLDNPFTTAAPTWFNHPDTSNMVAQTAGRQSNYGFVPAAIRLVVNSGAGSATLTIVQSGANRA
jgi:hypothetical protein